MCPISGALMADPVILASGRTYERACLQACAELEFLPPGVEPGGAETVIPNSALKAAIGTWCARTGRAVPASPSAQAAREAVLRAMPQAAKSVRTTARRPAVMAASSSNSSYSSPASTSSYGSSSEIVPAEEEENGGSARPVKEAAAQAQVVREVEVEAAPVDPLEDEVVAKVMDADEDGMVAAAMGALREATRESAERRRALCTPRLLGALRREHAAGALFGLALNEDNRAAIGVLGAVPPLLELLTSPAHPPRARRDAGMALYHLSLAAVNQSKVARFPGAPKALLAVASGAAEPGAIRRLALMVVCNVAACAEGRAALMDAGAVATASAILSGDGSRSSELQEWCVAALYAMSRGSPRFRGLARAAGADRQLMLIAEQASPGVHEDMAQMALRTMLGLADNSDDDQITECMSNEGNHGGGRVPHRRRVASWSAPPPATPASSHQWRSVCID